MLRKFENENKNQNKKNLRLEIYGKIRNGRLKLEPSVLIKKTCNNEICNAMAIEFKLQEKLYRALNDIFLVFALILLSVGALVFVVVVFSLNRYHCSYCFSFIFVFVPLQ